MSTVPSSVTLTCCCTASEVSGLRFNGYKNIDDVFMRKSANVHGLDNWLELMDFYYNWTIPHKNRIDELASEIIHYYKENISFVRQPGGAFGFTVHFIYQPIALLESNQ